MRRLNRTETALVLRRADELRAANPNRLTAGRTLRVAVLRKSRSHGLEIVIAATRRSEAKAIALWWPGAEGFRFRDTNFCGMSGWVTDWNVPRWDAEFAASGRRPYRYSGGYWIRDCWLSSDTDSIVKWDGRKTCLAHPDCIANPELLAETPYRYCGWTPECCYNLFEVLYDYAKDSRIEYLVKAGLYRQLRAPSKLAAIARDPALRRVIARHPNLVRESDWCDVLWLAANPKRKPEDAMARTRERRLQIDFFHSTRFTFPNGLDRGEAFRYCKAHGIDAGHYTEAMRLAAEQGLDVRSRSVAFPTDWKRFFRDRTRDRDKKVLAEFKDRDALVAAFVKRCDRALKDAKVDTGEYSLVWLRRQLDFKREGDLMRNCIGGGSYSLGMAERRCVCFVLVCGDERVDVEIGSDWAVRQCYAPGNRAPRAEATKVAARIAHALKRNFAAKRAA